MQRSEAEEHLRVIRSLMEKATVYRAISAPTALVGGLLSLTVGALLAGPFHVKAEHPTWFFAPWLAVLILSGIANIYFLRRESQRRGEPFISAGMKMALRALAPSHVFTGFASVLAALGTMYDYTAGVYLGLPGVWCLGYGLGLLAMEHFAPRSLTWLGWIFLLAGLAAGGVFFFWYGVGISLPPGLSATQISNATMALTFGLFHLVYAACTWPRAERAPEGIHA